jgi:putative ABC transport system ATP-binding protein
MIEVHKLCKQYRMGEVTVEALRGVDFSAHDGEFVAIMGPSGSGKSTFLHLLGGLDAATSGEIILDGQSMSNLSDDDMAVLRRQKIGFVFQFFNLMPTLTATENVALPLLIDGLDVTKHQSRIAELLAQVGLGERQHHKPNQLSGGQQQRVAIARALVTNPVIVLADEPTGNLDSQSSREVLTLLRKMADTEQQTIIMVTHDAHAASFADRILILRDGLIIHEIAEGEARTTQTIRAIMSELEQSL